MTIYKLTNKAEQEIEVIYEYSIANFGLLIAQNYILGVHDCFGLPANHQTFGSDYSFITVGLLRYEYRSHAIYYQRIDDSIVIVRVLGSKQDPSRHINT